MDDHPSVRNGLAKLLAIDLQLGPVETTATASRAIVCARRLHPAIAVVDYRLPGRDGISLTLELKRLAQPPRVAIHSAFASPRVALAAIVAGADAFVDKGAGVEELRGAVQAVARGGRVMPSLPAPWLSAVVARLCADDRLIVVMLASGASMEQVARALRIDSEWLELRRWALIRQVLAPGRRPSR